MGQSARLSRASIFYGVIFLIGAVWANAQGRNVLIADTWTLVGLVGHAAFGIAVGLLVALGSQRLAAHYMWARRLERALAEALGPFSTTGAILVALLSSVGEEALFRGAMQPAVGIVFTSLAFGLLHVGPGRVFLPWTGMAVAAGFLFGGLYLLTGNLLAPIAAHAVINFVNLRYLSLKYASGEAGVPPPWTGSQSS